MLNQLCLVLITRQSAHIVTGLNERDLECLASVLPGGLAKPKLLIVAFFKMAYDTSYYDLTVALLNLVHNLI